MSEEVVKLETEKTFHAYANFVRIRIDDVGPVLPELGNYGLTENFRGYDEARWDVAAKHRYNGWMVVTADIKHKRFSIPPQLEMRFDSVIVEVATPLDPGITAIDVIGASDVYVNADNTGFLFKHGTPAVHHDHLLDVRKSIVTLFQPAIDDVDLKWKESVARPTVAAIQLTKYRNLLAYRNDVVDLAITAEQLHPHGHFVRNAAPEVGHIHKAIQVALSAAKDKWAASPTTIAMYQTISSQVIAINTMMAVPHTPETRWEQAMRLEAEAKAAASAGE